MVADRVTLEIVILEDLPKTLDVAVLREGPANLEVVAPAGELEAIVAHLLCKWRELLEGKVCPLASEQGDRSCHCFPP